MFVRSVSFGAALAAVVLLPLACGSFNADAPPIDGSGEGGNGEAGTGTATEAGLGEGGPASEGSTPAGPVVLAQGYKDLRAITATETDVFFIDQAGGGGVFALPLIGGNARMLSVGGAPSSIAVDGNYVFWTDPANQNVQRAPIAGGTITKTPPFQPIGGFVPSIIVAAGDAVVTLTGSTGNSGVIQQFGLDLGTTTAAASGLTNPFSLAANGSLLYWTEGGAGYVASGQVGMTSRTPRFQEGDPEAIAADAAGVYWTIPSAGKIRGSIGGAAPITLASGENQPRSIAADGTYVYWTTSNNELRRSGHQENGTSSLFASGFMPLTEMHVRAIAVTSTYVVWLTADGKVMRASSH